jgi:hypothetical protein
MKLFLRSGTYCKPDCLCDPTVLNVTTGSLVKALALSLRATKGLPNPFMHPTPHPTNAHKDASRHHFTNTVYGRIFSITQFPFLIVSLSSLILLSFIDTTVLCWSFLLHYTLYYRFSGFVRRLLQFGIPHYKLLVVVLLFQLLATVRPCGTLHALALCSLEL